MDPLSQYQKETDYHLMAAMGLLPYFVAEVSNGSPSGGAEALEAMSGCYGLPVNNMLESGLGSVSEVGVYSYPEDPDMYPYAEFGVGTEIQIFVYPYGMVYIRDEDGFEAMVRMD
jgi:hypothetical protein